MRFLTGDYGFQEKIIHQIRQQNDRQAAELPGRTESQAGGVGRDPIPRQVHVGVNVRRHHISGSDRLEGFRYHEGQPLVGFRLFQGHNPDHRQEML